MVDFSKLSEADLQAIANDRMQDVSEAGLRLIAGKQTPVERIGGAIEELSGIPRQDGRLTLLEGAKKPTQQFAATDTDVLRQLGLTARAGVTGALGLPTLASDALVSLINMIGGRNIPMPSQAQQQLLTRAGLPEPATPQERTVQDVTSAMAGVLGGYGLGAAMPPTMAAREVLMSSPSFQLGSGAAAAGASALAREEGAGPLEQLGLGMLAGTVAPSAGAATAVTAQRAAAGAREAVRPFTEAGREVIVGNVLRQLAREPESAAARMEQYVPGVPGYTPTAPQAARDIGLAGAVPAVRAMDETGRFPAQQIQANQARMAILDRMAKNEQAVETAYRRRDEVTDPLREAAFAKVTITPEEFAPKVQAVRDRIDEILQSDLGRRTAVQKAMRFAREKLDDPNAPVLTPQQLYEVRKDINDAAQGLLDKEQGVFRLAKSQLDDIKRLADQQIEDAAPGYRDYLKKYAQISTGIERLEAAQKFRGKVIGTVPVVTDPSNAAQYMVEQPKFVRAIREVEANDQLGGLSKAQVAVLKRVGRDLDEGAITRLTAEPGSNTFKNLSIANVIGGIVGKQMFGEIPAAAQKGAGGVAALNWLYGGPDDAIRAVLVDAMLDPKLAARMMRKATTAELVPISKELQQRALKLGYGQVFGLTPE